MGSSNSVLGRKNAMDLKFFLLFCRRSLDSACNITQRAENGLLKPATSLVPHPGVTSLMNSSVKELRIGSLRLFGMDT